MPHGADQTPVSASSSRFRSNLPPNLCPHSFGFTSLSQEDAVVVNGFQQRMLVGVGRKTLWLWYGENCLGETTVA